MEALEQVQVHAEGVGEDGVDDVPGAHRRPHRARSMFGLERGAWHPTAATERACIVFSGVAQGHHVRFLRFRELGLLAAKPAPGYLHALSGAGESDELGDDQGVPVTNRNPSLA